MNLIVVVASVSCIGLIAVCFYLYREAAEAERYASMLDRWIAGLSAEHYRHMPRLLTGAAVRFLRSQPGATPALVRLARRQRQDALDEYLLGMQDDYRRACRILLFLVLRADLDEPGLLSRLIRRRTIFHAMVFGVRCGVRLNFDGMANAGARRLMVQFEDMWAELRRVQLLTSKNVASVPVAAVAAGGYR